MKDLTLKPLFFCGLFIFVTSGFLTGCALFNDWLEQDTIAEYGESVFRKQNLLTSQVMLLSDSELPAPDHQKLQQAESKMRKDCHLLNEYATREMDKTSSNLVFQKQVRDSIKDCDLSIHAMESLLNQLGIND